MVYTVCLHVLGAPDRCKIGLWSHFSSLPGPGKHVFPNGSYCMCIPSIRSISLDGGPAA